MLFITFDEIVEDMLLFQLTEKQKKQLRTLKQEELILLHHTFGQAIRNHYRLWDTDNPLTLLNYQEILSDDGVDINPKHPDNISMEVIETVWKRLQ